MSIVIPNVSEGSGRVGGALNLHCVTPVRPDPSLMLPRNSQCLCGL